MPCDLDPERLSVYHDGEGSPAERADVERHLAACPDCRETLRRFAENDDALRRAVAVSETLGREIPVDRIAAPRPSPWLPLAAAAALLGIAATGWLVYRPYVSGPGPSTKHMASKSDMTTTVPDGGRVEAPVTAAIPDVVGLCDAVLLWSANLDAGSAEELAGLQASLADNGVTPKVDAALSACASWSAPPAPELPEEATKYLTEIKGVLTEIQSIPPADAGGRAQRLLAVQERILDRGLVDQSALLRRQFIAAGPDASAPAMKHSK
jgi:hypothetical protein